MLALGQYPIPELSGKKVAQNLIRVGKSPQCREGFEIRIDL